MAIKTVKKHFSNLIVLLCAFVVLLSSCTVRDATADYSVGEIINDIFEQIAFVDELMQVQGRRFEEFYGIDPEMLEEYAAYLSSSWATAEEVTVIRAKTEEDANVIESALYDRINDQKLGFENYNTHEMIKLNNAVVVKNGVVVMMIIADDYEAARKLLDKYK